MNLRRLKNLLVVTSICAAAICCTAGCSLFGGDEKEGDPAIPEAGEDVSPPPNAAASLTAEEELLERATKAYDRELFSLALEHFTKLRDEHPLSYYGSLAELKIADCQFFLGEYEAAVAAYEEFAKLHPGHEAVPYVRFQIAASHREQYRGTLHDQTPLRSAITNYQRLIDEFPKSSFTAQAKQEIAAARERLAEHEVYVARFYRKQGLRRASSSRIRRLEREFKESGAAKSALVDLGDVEAHPEPPALVAIESPASRADGNGEAPTAPAIVAVKTAQTGTPPGSPEVVATVGGRPPGPPDVLRLKTTGQSPVPPKIVAVRTRSGPARPELVAEKRIGQPGQRPRRPQVVAARVQAAANRPSAPLLLAARPILAARYGLARSGEAAKVSARPGVPAVLAPEDLRIMSLKCESAGRSSLFSATMNAAVRIVRQRDLSVSRTEVILASAPSETTLVAASIDAGARPIKECRARQGHLAFYPVTNLVLDPPLADAQAFRAVLSLPAGGSYKMGPVDGRPGLFIASVTGRR